MVQLAATVSVANFQLIMFEKLASSLKIVDKEKTEDNDALLQTCK